MDRADHDFRLFFSKKYTATADQPPLDLLPSDREALLDELVTMALPLTALELVKQFPSVTESTSFSTQLAIGIAAMMADDLTQAEAAFRRAQELIPEEPAPYVNLGQIFIKTSRPRDAEIWIMAGLEAQANHHPLWELLYQLLLDTKGDYAPEEVLAIAQDKSSWAGTSLGTSLKTTGDRHFKASHLEKFFHLGERDPLFLIELTGAYGVAQEFEKIPPIVWQAEKLSTKTLPWQLHAHGAQAELALGAYDKALVHVKKARKDKFLSEAGTFALEDLEAEIQQAKNSDLETFNQNPPLT
jgi:tetratricopeptide (TPR) repeat protein